MSEFSDCYLFLGSPAELRAAAAKSEDVPVVVATGTRWVTFLLAGVTGDPPPPRLAGTIVRWTLAEDHGWTFDLYADGKCRFSFEQAWDPSPRAPVVEGRLSDVAALLGESEAALEPYLGDVQADADEGGSRARGLATQLQWPASSWISHRHRPEAPPVERRGEPCANRVRMARRIRRAHEAGLLQLTSLDDAVSVAIALSDELAIPNRLFNGVSLADWLMELPEIVRVDADDRDLGAALLM